MPSNWKIINLTSELQFFEITNIASYFDASYLVLMIQSECILVISASIPLSSLIADMSAYPMMDYGISLDNRRVPDEEQYKVESR